MIKEYCGLARQSARQLANISSRQKDHFLEELADNLWQEREAILAANQKDVESAIQKGLNDALIDRLTLNEERINAMRASLAQVESLPDPVGTRFDERTLPNGLVLYKQRVPLGVLAVIYESRPNVTIEVASLALKTGNALVLRGGSETITTNASLVNCIRSALLEAGLPEHSVVFISDPDRALVLELLRMHNDIDMLIPRGGAQLHQFCRENSSIPVITGGIGICHLFVDASANLAAALPLIRNAKIQRPTVCNALDTVLVHSDIAGIFLPGLVDLLEKDGVQFRVHPDTLPYLGSRNGPTLTPAGPADFDTEWLSLVLGIKVVSSLDEAIEHIAIHSTSHSDGILTEDPANASQFTARVDSAVVYVNASTRFTDGGEFGMGAEVAVSTQRLHARGPMGLQELTTYKWVVTGQYHLRP